MTFFIHVFSLITGDNYFWLAWGLSCREWQMLSSSHPMWGPLDSELFSPCSYFSKIVNYWGGVSNISVCAFTSDLSHEIIWVFVFTRPCLQILRCYSDIIVTKQSSPIYLNYDIILRTLVLISEDFQSKVIFIPRPPLFLLPQCKVIQIVSTSCNIHTQSTWL